MMRLEEAIDHCEEVAKIECGKCAEEHLQLAKWLKELKERRIQPKRGKWNYNSEIGTFKILTCDQCGWNSEAGFNYCPNCGAKMEVTDGND